jgi:hypothetical protein
VFPPDFSANFLYCFLQLESIAMHRNLKIANGVAAGQVAHRIAGQEKDSSSISGYLAQLTERMALIGR